MFNDVYAIGETVKIEGLKSAVQLIEVGKHFMRAEGTRGSKWFICMDGGKIKALNVRSNTTREVLNHKNIFPVIGFIKA